MKKEKREWKGWRVIRLAKMWSNWGPNWRRQSHTYDWGGQAGCATPNTLAICLSRGVDPTARVTMDTMSGCWIVMSGSCQGLSGSQYGDVPESPIFLFFLFSFVGSVVYS